jgi:hypothetical protein
MAGAGLALEREFSERVELFIGADADKDVSSGDGILGRRIGQEAPVGTTDGEDQCPSAIAKVR